MTFATLRIGDLGRVITGRTPPAANPEFYGEAYPFITPTDIQGDVRYIETIRSLSDEGFEALHRILLPRDAICVVCIGATIGKICLSSRPSFTNQQINSIIVDEAKYDPRYVFSAARQLQDELRAKAAGAATPIINKSAFQDIEIQVPSLPIQRRIAEILSAYDDLIEVNQRRIAILEEMARRLFDEWFVRFRYPGHEAVPLVETELGSVPEGWRAGVFADCVTVNPETLSPKKAPLRINYIDISSVSVGRVDAITPVDFADAPGRARRVVRDGDVIWSTVRPNRRSHALLLGLERDTIASTGFAVLRARNEEWAWAYESSKTDAFVGFLIGRARGAAYPAVVGSDFEEVPTLIPPQELRVDFQRQVGPMYESKAVLEAQNARLRAARDLLLPKLISGEIDVGRAEEALAEAAE